MVLPTRIYTDVRLLVEASAQSEQFVTQGQFGKGASHLKEARDALARICEALQQINPEACETLGIEFVGRNPQPKIAPGAPKAPSPGPVTTDDEDDNNPDDGDIIGDAAPKATPTQRKTNGRTSTKRNSSNGTRGDAAAAGGEDAAEDARSPAAAE